MYRAPLVAQRLKCLPAMWETLVRSLDREDPLEKEMATHSSILAWEIPWTEEPGGLQSTGSQRVGHDWATSLSLTMYHLSTKPDHRNKTETKKYFMSLQILPPNVIRSWLSVLFFTFGKARIVKCGFFQEWIGNFSVYSLRRETTFYIETKIVRLVPKMLLLPISKILQWIIRRSCPQF